MTPAVLEGFERVKTSKAHQLLKSVMKGEYQG